MGGIWLFRLNRGGPRTSRHRTALLLYIVVGLITALVGATMLHGWSAVFLFGVLACGSLIGGIALFRIDSDDAPKTSRHWKALGLSYLPVGLTMALAGGIIKKWPGPWDHRTLVLEMTEIGLFSAMWVVQSVERWGKILQPEPAAPQEVLSTWIR